MFDKKMLTIAGVGAALGATVMYLLDPKQGRRRRALLGDKLTHARHEAEDAVTGTARDARNRAKGVAHETKRRLEKEEVPDDVLVDRVRSEMGHLIEQPGAVTVTALGGRVTLSGAVKPDEGEKLTRELAEGQGVAGVETRLDVTETPRERPPAT